MNNYIRRHPVFFYYTLVFLISWGGILLLIGGPANIPGSSEQAERLLFPALIIMFTGPFVSGIVMNLFIEGKKGLKKLKLQLFRWQVKFKWYLIAVFTGPILVLAVLFGLSFIDKAFLPGIIASQDKIALIIFGISWGIIGGGLLEETGWTGFAVPQLRKNYSILSTGIIVGILWGIWHIMIAFWASNYMRGNDSWFMFVMSFLAFYFLVLPAYRVLLVAVYDKTKSLLIIMIMHAVLSSSTLIFQPLSAGKIAFVWNFVLGLFLCVIVAAIVIKYRDYFLQNPKN